MNITISALDGRRAAATAALVLTGDPEGALVAADGNTLAVVTGLMLTQAIAEQIPELDPERWALIADELRRRAAEIGITRNYETGQ